MSEKRTETRKPLHARAKMTCNGHCIESKTLNVSLGGLSLESPVNLKTGTKLGVSFTMHKGSRFTTVQVDCEVIHCIVGAGGGGFKAGLRFGNLAASDRQAITDYLAN